MNFEQIDLLRDSKTSFDEATKKSNKTPFLDIADSNKFICSILLILFSCDYIQYFINT